MLLNAEQDGRGYAFVLTSDDGSPRPDAAPLPTLAAAIQSGGTIYAEMRRDGQSLRREALILSDKGPLTLRARREANQLEFQVGTLKPIPFVDAFPPPSRQGGHGLWQPAGPRLVSLNCRRQTLPQSASPLENADELFARRQYAEALTAYEQESTSAAGSEARFKAALCLEETNRPDEAAKRLERVAGEPGERWPILAAFRLWFLYLQQGRTDQAEDVFQGLAARVQAEDVPLFLPEKMRSDLASRFAESKWGLNYLRANDESVRRIEKTVRALEVLQASPEAVGSAYHLLARVEWMVGRSDQAADAADGWLRQCERIEPPLRRLRSAANVLVDRLWMARSTGPAEMRKERVRLALQNLDRWLAPFSGTPETQWPEEYVRCRLERVRLLIALEDWSAAESDLARCLRRVDDTAGRIPYVAFADAHGMDGFLRQRRNDAAGATQTWRRGTLMGFAETHPSVNAGLSSATSAALAAHLFMALKTGAADDAEVARVMEGLLSGNSDATLSQFVKLAGITPTTIRHAFESRRCEELMRRGALGELSMPDMFRGPARLVALERMREGAFGGDLSAEQEALAWQLTDGMFALYASNGGSKRQFMQLGLTWMGTTGFLGWGSVAPELKPSLRGPLAYVMGRRLLVLQKPADAQMLFQTALNDAPAGSSLRRLAQQELDKLKAK